MRQPLAQFAAPAIGRAKHAVPPHVRERIRMALRELRLQARSVRNGVSPVSIVRRRLLGQRDHLRFRGVDVQGPDMDSAWFVARDLWAHGEYDVPGFMPMPGWRVVDIGGNVGLYAMHAAARGARVTSFEPHPEAARCLRANTSRWGVECREAAVVGSSSSGPMRLYVNPTRDIRHTLLGRDVRTGEELSHAIEVPTVPIAEVLSEPVDLLKVDCEGGEFDIFAAGPEALANARRIIAEVHVNMGDPDEAVSALEAAGFAVTLHDTPHPGSPYVQLTATRR